MNAVSSPGLSSETWRQISRQISTFTGQPFAIEAIRPVTGGCINRAVIVDDGSRCYFVKLNASCLRSMFEAEADGLRELAQAKALRVPLPLCIGHCREHAWLVLDYLGAMNPGVPQAWAKLGHGLASLHKHRQSAYGWHRDNTIGANAQDNTRSDDWVTFLRDRRIGYQLDLACRNGHSAPLRQRGDRLLDCLPGFFAHYTPEASLLHGDLWTGNVGFLDNQEPVIFDPAVYYGDREADIAMTELFGAFGAEFYRAYAANWPLDAGYQLRKHLYNLYHLLNHLNLFGRSYLPQCESTIDFLLARAG